MSLIVGVIGHVDHGKTALVRALTGMETDRLEEEHRRGISIALGFAHLACGDGQVIDLIDMPGHERFIRTMISGATGIRAVLLVVAANEGIKPQTIEHAEIAALLGVPAGVVAVTKCDLVSPERAEDIGAKSCALLRGLGLEAPAPIQICALDGRGVGALARAMAAMAARTPPAADRGACTMPIDRCFTVAGHGTVVTGTLRWGSVAPGDELEIDGSGSRVRVRAVQVRGSPVAVAAPGQRVAINLRGVGLSAVARGSCLASPGLLAGSSYLTVVLRAPPRTLESGAPVLATGARLRLLYGVSETGATLRLLDRAGLAPGETCFAQLRCETRVALASGEGVILRLPSSRLIVAGGQVLDPAPQRLRRADPAAIEWAATLAREPPERIVSLALARASMRGVAVVELARLSGLSAVRTQAALRGAGSEIIGGIAVTREALEAARAAILRALETRWPDQPRGVTLDQVRAALPGCGAAVLDLALTGLAGSGRIERTSRVRLLRPEQEKCRLMSEELLAARLAQTFRRAGLSPPTAAPADPSIRRALDRLVREGVLVRAPDRVQKREILFHREAIEQACRTLRPLLASGPGILVGDAGGALGISRKYSVPLLEHLDAIHFTRRVGDRRQMR